MRWLVILIVMGAFPVMAQAELASQGMGAARIGEQGMRMQGPSRMTDEQEMENVRIVLKKLRMAAMSVNDIDEMGNLGMPDNEIERLKTALMLKIQQLTSEAIYAIHKL